MNASRCRHRSAKVEVMNNHNRRETSEMQVTTIGLDIAKNLFQVHGIDARGRVVLRKRLTRTKVLTFFANLPRCVIGLEAGGGAHYWGTGADPARPRRSPDAAAVRQGLRQDQQA
jgi:hypothetical protein